MNAVWRNIFKVAATALLVAGCGGGGGGMSGGTASAPPPAGSSKTMIVKGAIAGFGSVIINGVHYETDSATVRIEGKPASVMDLKVGEVIRLVAEKDSQGVSHATTIDEDHLIQGAVEAVDPVAGTLTIAGQLIRVDADTSFDDSIPTHSLAGIAVGDRIEVHGFVMADGTARATRIEKASATDTEVEATGAIDSLDTVAMRFVVGTLTVDYSTATLDGFGSAGIAAGEIVEVKGTAFLADGALKADRVSLEDGETEAKSGDESEMEGFVTRFTSATDFAVDGQQVTTNGNTQFVNGTGADLALNVKLEVEGTFDANGTLVADKIVFEHEASVRLSAKVDAVDATAGTVTVLGLTVAVDATTRREDQEGEDHFFSLADLHVGDWVEIAGVVDTTGAADIVATKLERTNPGNAVELRGTAGGVDASGFTVLGVRVALQPSTAFEIDGQHVAAADFIAATDGKVVDVEGSWDGTTLLADHVEIDTQHGGDSSGPGDGSTSPGG